MSQKNLKNVLKNALKNTSVRKLDYFLSFLVLRVVSSLLGFPALQAIALLSPEFVGRTFQAYILMALLLFGGDWLLDGIQVGHFTLFYAGWYWQYLGFFAVVLLGDRLLRINTLARMLLGAILAPLVFFVISNFGVWCQGALYPMSAAGLLQCFVMGLPFLKISMLSTLFYCTLAYPLLRLQTRSRTGIYYA